MILQRIKRQLDITGAFLYEEDISIHMVPPLGLGVTDPRVACLKYCW